MREKEKEHRRAMQLLNKEQREKERAAKRAGSNQGLSFGKLAAASGVGSLVSGLVSSAVSSAMATVGSAVRESMSLRESSNRISINSRQAGQSFADPRMLDSKFLSASMQSGGVVSAGDIAAGAGSFVAKTGDLNAFMDSLSVLTTTAAATGANFEDVSSMAAELSSKFGLSGDALGDSLAQIVAAGKAGSFELKDAASLFGKAAAAGSAYGLRGNAGAQQLSGFLQLARTGTGSAEQATTSVEAVFSALQSKKHLLDKGGVKGGDFASIIANSMTKLNDREFNSVYGEQGMRALNPLKTTYQDTLAATSGTKAQKVAAAEAAVIAQLKTAQGDAVGFAELQKDAAQAATSASASLNQAWTTVVATISESSIPDALAKAANQFATIIQTNSGTLEVAFSLLAESVTYAAETIMNALGVDTTKIKAQQELNRTATEFRGKEIKRIDAQMEEARAAGDTEKVRALQDEKLNVIEGTDTVVRQTDAQKAFELAVETEKARVSTVPFAKTEYGALPFQEVTEEQIRAKVTKDNPELKQLASTAAVTMADLKSLGDAARTTADLIKDIPKTKPIADRTGGS